MAEEAWHAARLIPTSGISGAEEQERRATSALLAVMSVVREFGRSLTQRFGAPAAGLETYIEVPFEHEGRRLYPDGLIRATRGAKSWTALVEVKTGTNELEVPQLEAYLDIARAHGFDAVLTISNEIPSVPGMHPTAVDKRKLKKVAIHHLSWTQVLTEAVIHKTHRGIADPEQAWILGELIRYLEHPRSGALEGHDLGASWVPVREAVSMGTLRASDKGAAQVAARWDSLIQYVALRLGRQLGAEVQPNLTRKELAEPAGRATALVQGLVSSGRLDGGVRVPHTVGPLMLCADVRAGQISAFVDIEAPRDGRPLTRINWLVRQLKDAPDTLRVDAVSAHSRGGGTSALLRDVRANPSLLIDDPKKEIRSFRLTVTATMGLRRGSGRGTFVTSLLDLVDAFYGQVLSVLRAWSAVPPKLRTPEEPEVSEPGVPAALVSTALSSQDDELGEGTRNALAPASPAPVEDGGGRLATGDLAPSLTAESGALSATTTDTSANG